MGRRYGQHFLKRDSTLRRIAEAACANPHIPVVEIGPGRGALTAYLLERARRVIAIEIDPELVRHLSQRFSDCSHLELLQADVLAVDLKQWGRVAVAGNLPYYITSPILEQTLALGDQLEKAVFLVQREVAERLTASPGSRDYGFLTVRTQLLADVRILEHVPASAFSPPPKVDSAVIELQPKPTAISEAAAVLRFLSACFQQKRKTLRNNLSKLYDRQQLEAVIDAKVRAEQMSLEELLRLHRILKAS
jgi:16S rRNA (adenine1518-N6/adenine1519-N6)-dimethyltransferase